MSAVIASPSATKFSPDDLFRLPDGGKGFELVDGELKELGVSFLSTFVAGRAFNRLCNHVEAGNLGWASPEGTSCRCFPDHPEKVRRADVSFHRLARLTSDQATREGHCTVVPDFVIEVVSPNDSYELVDQKRDEWQDAGAELVWIINPSTQTVHVYRADGSVDVFYRHEELTAEPVLPEFRITVGDLFKLPGT